MKKKLLGGLLIVAASVFADSAPKSKGCDSCMRKGEIPLVSTDSHPCDDVGFYIFADALYWYADVSNSDWAFVAKNILDNPNLIKGPNQELAFKWNWGFRVGLGYDFNHDYWDSDIYYTWFRSSSAGNSSTSSRSFTTSILDEASSLNSALPNSPFSILSGSADMKLNFDVLDWELGRAFYASHSISLRPHLGIKAAWIKLAEKEHFTSSETPETYDVSNTNKSWAIGPSAGFNTNWYFGPDNTKNRPMFSIFGDLAGALMYGHFKNSHSENGPDGYGFHPTHLNRNLMVPVLSGIMGFSWDICFDSNRRHFGIRAGYELQYWFRQSQRFFFNGLTGEIPAYLRSANALALQGLTVDVRFDF